MTKAGEGVLAGALDALAYLQGDESRGRAYKVSPEGEFAQAKRGCPMVQKHKVPPANKKQRSGK